MRKHAARILAAAMLAVVTVTAVVEAGEGSAERSSGNLRAGLPQGRRFLAVERGGLEGQVEGQSTMPDHPSAESLSAAWAQWQQDVPEAQPPAPLQSSVQPPGNDSQVTALTRGQLTPSAASLSAAWSQWQQETPEVQPPVPPPSTVQLPGGAPQAAAWTQSQQEHPDAQQPESLQPAAPTFNALKAAAWAQAHKVVAAASGTLSNDTVWTPSQEGDPETADVDDDRLAEAANFSETSGGTDVVDEGLGESTAAGAEDDRSAEAPDQPEDSNVSSHCQADDAASFAERWERQRQLSLMQGLSTVVRGVRGSRRLVRLPRASAARHVAASATSSLGVALAGLGAVKQSFEALARRQDDDGMLEFIRGVVEEVGGTIVDEAGLSRILPLYTGEADLQPFARLMEELAATAALPDGWLRMPRDSRYNALQMGYGSQSFPAGVGNVSTLSEPGYEAVAFTRRSPEMETFVLRAAAQLGCEVHDQGGLQGFVPFYSGECGTRSFDVLVKDLQAVASLPDQWLRYNITVDQVQANESVESGE